MHGFGIRMSSRRVDVLAMEKPRMGHIMHCGVVKSTILMPPTPNKLDYGSSHACFLEEGPIKRSETKARLTHARAHVPAPD
jgi:hypothetical protein